MRKIRQKPKLHNRHQRAYRTENWHKPEYADDPDNAPTLHANPPTRYERHFLQKMDKRSRAYALLKESFDEITADLGGAESLSHIQLTLVERFCFLEFVLRKKELEMAEPSNNGQRDKQIGSWVQSLNALVGLAKSIGLERRARQVTNLRDYVASKRQRDI